MIDSYQFGRICIDQKTYVKDVIILPEGIRDNWWRKEGHLLQFADIGNAVDEADPEIVVVGKGKFGVMRVSPEVEQYLREKNIRLYAEKSDQAVEIFNRFVSAGRRVLGAFHLTC